MFARVDAAKIYTQSAGATNPKKQEELELAAFMAIFHPNHKKELKDE